MPGQGDLNQARYGSTGDYTSIVFYPSTVAECYEYTIHAFNAAEESRSPVILLSDAFLGHLNEVADLDAIDVPVVPRTLEPLASGGTRLFSGVATYPDGEPATADADEFIRQYHEVRDHRLRVAEQYAFYEYGWNKESDTLVIAFGITPPHRPAAGRPLRALPPDPDLADPGQGADRDRGPLQEDRRHRGQRRAVRQRRRADAPAPRRARAAARRPDEHRGDPRRPRRIGMLPAEPAPSASGSRRLGVG